MGRRSDIPKVYLVTFPNGKQYVGITTATLKERKVEHYSRTRSGSSFAIHNALIKYESKEKWEVLKYCSSYEEAQKLEIEYIKNLNTLAPNGYNLTEGGGGCKGYKLSDVQRKRLSDSHLGYTMPESQKIAISKANTGKSKTYAKKIKRIDLKTNEVKMYDNYLEVSKDGDFCRGSVYKVIGNKRAQHKGFKWEFVI